MPERWSAFDLAEGFQLSHAVWTLHHLGLLGALATPLTAKQLAARHSLDAGLVSGLLAYVAARTDLLRRKGARFVATRHAAGAPAFLLDLYVGAFGGNAAGLGALLRRPSLAPRAIDRALQARAFAGAPDSGALPAIIRGLGFTRLLDLGCGSGALLADLAAKDADFTGWGIDANRAMCRAARRRLRAAGAGRRVRILEGDCRDLARAVPPAIRADVGAVAAGDLANEMFAEGDGAVIAWLHRMRALFPGRPLLLADYYGRLGAGAGKASRETLLHDYVQLISGQGIPPASAAQWRRIYAGAGCRLLHVIEDKRTTRFIHLVRL